MKKAGRLESQQDLFNVGQQLLVVTNAIALDDSVTDVSRHVIDIKISGTWKELTEGGIGWSWNESKNKFLGPQPFASWSLNASDIWEAPIAEPANTTFTQDDYTIDTYWMTWNETDQRWEGLNREDNNNYYWTPTDSTWNLIT